MTKAEWLNIINSKINNLPGEKSHIEMIPYRLPSSSFKLKYDSAKLSAVMCLFFEKNNEMYGLLMERTDDGGKHSGQISFPGGKKDVTDANLKQTALRETDEEIGIENRLITVLGELTQVYIPVSNFLIQPFLGVIENGFNLKLSKKEVKSVFEFKLMDLLKPETKQIQSIKNHKGIVMKNIPCFMFDDKIVWGTTSLILNEIKKLCI